METDLVERPFATPLAESIDSQRSLTQSRERPAAKSDWFNKLFWLLCVGAFFYGVVQLGPILIERYQYAATTGRVKAEYENAVNLLKDDPLSGLSKSYQLVAQVIKPSVVSIKCLKVATVNGRGRPVVVGAGQGSGVIISRDGHIVTNAHVIADSQNIIVKLHDRREVEAELIGSDEITDVAVLKIKAEKLIPADWGDSDLLEVGALVWAIGTPYELEQTVTSGVISGKNRYERDYRNAEKVQQELIQTDAAVNPGNSGGPLVNSQGQVIGINTSIYGDKFQGISFAVPSAIARYVAEQLMTNGQVRRGFLGFIPRSVDAEIAEQLELPDFDGAIVESVTPNSPADEAGMKVNDVIRNWNGVKVQDHRDIFRLVATTPPDSKAQVEIVRNGRTLQLEVTTGDRDKMMERF